MNSALKTALIASTFALAIAVVSDKLNIRQRNVNSEMTLISNDSYNAYGNENNDQQRLTAGNKVKITDQWDMPSALKEISGITYLGDNSFACIQDEVGKIFIYNTNKGKIEQEISFRANGDYEGIAIVGTTAYVVRSDGTLFEVKQYRNKKPSVTQHDTHLTKSHDVEGLCYDEQNNRLLLAVKGSESHTNDYKGIYAFDLTTKKLGKDPVYKIDLKDKVFKKYKEKGVKSVFNPSGMAIHPITKDIYIVEGTRPKLLVLDAMGTIKNLYSLNKKQFEQPEGISFNNSGEMYISNEAGKQGKGNIVKVQIQ